MHCRNCGNQVADNSGTCPNCGAGTENEVSLQNLEKKWYQKKHSEMNVREKKKYYTLITTMTVLLSIIFIFVLWNSGDSVLDEKLEIVGTPKMTVEYNEYLGYSVSIKGQARNNGGTTSYVSVTFNLYDLNGNVIDSVMDNHNTLSNGAVWNFDASVGYYGQVRPARFELADIICY